MNKIFYFDLAFSIEVRYIINEFHCGFYPDHEKFCSHPLITSDYLACC